MKEILIAGSCAILLCFTSCATKQAPENDSQVAAPQAETADTTEENSSDENNQAETEENTSESTLETSSENQSENDGLLSSEEVLSSGFSDSEVSSVAGSVVSSFSSAITVISGGSSF